MALLLEYCGLNLRSATIIISILSMFFSGYRIVKESTQIVVLKSVETDGYRPQDADLPKDSVPILLNILYTGVSVAGVMFLCSALMLYGVSKSIPNFMFLWIVVSCVYTFLDLSVIIYSGVAYYNLSGVALAIVLASLWDAVDIYFIIVVGAYFKSLQDVLLRGLGIRIWKR